MRHPRRPLQSALPIFAIVAAAVLLSGCGGPFPQSALRPASDFATSLDDLFRGIFFWSVIVFVLVEGALLLAVFRFRDREGKRSAEHVHGNTILEIAWTIAPAFILLLIAVPTIRTIWEVDRPTTDPDALLIEAVGRQWWWEFRYPDLGIVTANEIHVPVGTAVYYEGEATEPGERPPWLDESASPVEGITRAIRSFASRDKRVSIYVFGDEFTGRSITEVLDAIERINTRDAQGQPRVRINAIGFPVMFTQPGVRDFTGERFATLMRELCRENGGTFVGLNRVVP